MNTTDTITGPMWPEHAALIRRIDRLARRLRSCMDEPVPGSAYADEDTSAGHWPRSTHRSETVR